jgi:lipopolysaccharide biosynthesis regulator YciM
MTKAEEIYHRFVNYEWNEIGEGMKVSIIKAIDEALKEGQKLPIHNVSGSALKTCPNCKTKNYHYYTKTNSWCCAFC